MLKLSYDLHIHSCLSPCGDDDMLPSNIVGMAALKELDVIAVTDHNSCKNCPAVMKLAEDYGVLAIPGMEICTSEEVHVICLFPDLQKAMLFDNYVSSLILKTPNNEDIFGKQEIYDENDNIIGNEHYLLINAVNINFDNLYHIITQYGGIMIPAHIDKASNSLISNLGFIPPESKFKCVEIKNIEKKDNMISQHNYLKNCNIITNSDAHYLGDINEPINFLYAENKSIQDVLTALITNK